MGISRLESKVTERLSIVCSVTFTCIFAPLYSILFLNATKIIRIKTYAKTFTWKLQNIQHKDHSGYTSQHQFQYTDGTDLAPQLWPQGHRSLRKTCWHLQKKSKPQYSLIILKVRGGTLTLHSQAWIANICRYGTYALGRKQDAASVDSKRCTPGFPVMSRTTEKQITNHM